tara:strand:- start:1804 stop:2739 length:936 start_codon:yes stop_codon:yes gene_type:complete
MKKVFTNSMACHVWAQQTQEEGRNSQSSILFEGKTIYSYGKHFWMGHFIKPDVVLLNSESYSVTTGQHQNEVHNAIWGTTSFLVPSMYDHSKNIAYLKEEIEIILKGAEKARRSTGYNYTSSALESAKHHIQRARENESIYQNYCLEFKLTPDFVFPSARVVEIIKKKTALDAKWDDPKAQAKRAVDKLKREKAQRKKEIVSTRQAVKKFRAGGNFYGYYTKFSFPVLLRLDGDMVKTSERAEMPVKFAKAIWQMVAHCKKSKTTFTPNGKTLNAGHFQVNKIEANGTLKAGCHTIKYGILKNMARQLELI